MSLGPTSLFFLVLLALRFRATVPSVASFITFCQLISAPPMLRLLEENYYAHPYHGAEKNALIAVINLGTIWNLDFFRVLNSPFCLHPNARPLDILALDWTTSLHFTHWPSSSLPMHWSLSTTMTAHLWCGCGNHFVDVSLDFEWNGTFRTLLLMLLQRFSSCLMSSF